MNHEEDQGSHGGDQPGDETLVRWRPWPCESCSGGTTALGFFFRGAGANPEVPDLGRNEKIDWLKRWQAARLLEWVEGCPHTNWSDLRLPRLAEGSEHLVLFDEKTSEGAEDQKTSEVVKITRPGTYGDFYEIVDGRISQFDSTPAEYLRRLRWWEKLFSGAPRPLGVTQTGQIVSRQRFISGTEPGQAEVDRFLEEAGLGAVRKSCWLWKTLEEFSLFEVWVGDARADNFVLTPAGIVPIDIRIWLVPVAAHSRHTSV